VDECFIYKILEVKIVPLAYRNSICPFRAHFSRIQPYSTLGANFHGGQVYPMGNQIFDASCGSYMTSSRWIPIFVTTRLAPLQNPLFLAATYSTTSEDGTNIAPTDFKGSDTDKAPLQNMNTIIHKDDENFSISFLFVNASLFKALLFLHARSLPV